MKTFLKRIAALSLSLLMLLGCLSFSALGAAPPAPEALTILFTHDTHDHFLPAAKENGGEYGGYTRLATLIKQARAKAEHPVITLDAGDFSMGTLFQTIYSSDAPELRALGAMGYDVTTLGNHEFDYRAEGLVSMLSAAKKSGDPLPRLVQANYRPKPEADAAVAQAMADFPVTDYTILERDGLKIGVFGVMGVDADECAPMSGMALEPMEDAAKRVVAQMNEKEQPDYIICLSHGGTSKDPKKSEDEMLAKAVPDIDVIISGHTHSTLPEPIRVGETLIVSAGEYTTNLGVLTVEKNGDTLALQDYKLLPVDETVAADPKLQALAQSFKPLVEQEYLANYGMRFDQVLAHSAFGFTPVSQFAAEQAEDSLGNLITDAYIYAVHQAEGASYIPVDFAVVASGVVRGSFAAGDITLPDAFNVSSLGSGGDGTPGYPLISVWLTGKELKDACEVDASVTPLMSAAQLYGSGMEWTFNPHRMIFNKVTDCKQVLPDGTKKDLEDGKLYRCVTGLYSGQMLGAVNSKSFGILSVSPKDAAGKPITDFETQIIYNQNGSEVKEWYALASYLASFPAENGVPKVPAKYAAAEGRKIIVESRNPIELLKSPN
ncbi:MAG: bifunctional UDP-sugar hydrolase/5'-nucleotidase, partial [Pseudoflavonifractor sp.]